MSVDTDVAPETPAVDDQPEGRTRRRRIVGGVVTGLAATVLVLAVLVPNQQDLLTPAGFVRIPLEALLAFGLLLILPGRARWVGAALVGLLLGVLTVLKFVDMGFYTAFGRAFDPVLDWSFFRPAFEFAGEAIGASATTVTVAAVALAVIVLILVTLAVVRLVPLLSRYRLRAGAALTGLAAVWVALALLGTEVVPGQPVATQEYARAQQMHSALQDQAAFAAELADDPFADVPADQLLTALAGKDVLVTYIESYGRDAVADPELAARIEPLLADGGDRLAEVGLGARSGFLTSPVRGGGSWLAHATLMSGLWINQGRYGTLVDSDRLSLNQLFGRAGWRTVAMMPGITREWPEGGFYGYDQLYPANGMGYRGPRMNWGWIPDQYVLSAFERLERSQPGRGPVMAEMPLLSGHGPWTPLPTLVDWEEVGDGSDFVEPVTDPTPEEVLRDPAVARTAYMDAMAYCLQTMISYLETYGDEDLVVVFLGDHQPAPLVTGEDATRDVPITIVAGEDVLDRIDGWEWDDGLMPGPDAPVWRMDAFRNEFLTAFGPPTG